jgi:hypothetical protein
MRISPWRKAAYYGGGALIALGIVAFGATFLLASDRVDGAGDANAWPPRAWTLGMLGLGIAAVGMFLRHLGARGLAGSGLLLDPSRARDDLKPYSRMTGGVIKDTLQAADLHPADPPAPLVKLRCRACSALSPEDAKFCSACGKPL